MKGIRLTSIVLSAGKGKRMRSSLPKVLHTVLGKPSLFWVLDVARGVGEDIVVVVGHKAEEVERAISANGYEVKTVVQERLDGTGGAVKRAIARAEGDWALILCGDMPLVRLSSVRRLIRAGLKRGTGAVLVARTQDAGSYGRVWIEGGVVVEIVEKSDLGRRPDPGVINTGVYVIRTDLLREAVKSLKANNRQQELYLTDVVSYLHRKGTSLVPVFCDEDEALGINSRKELAVVESIARRRIVESLMDKGITIHMPETVWIEVDVKIGRDTEIFPFTVIRRGVKIGKSCQIGPFAHIRSGTVIKDNCIIGNFVEVNRSLLEERVYAKHLTYLGDTRVGRFTNIGAGTITANYDGKRKHRTTIGSSAFIGSGAILIAPVRIGKRAVVGAGAVVTKGHDVRDGAVVVGVPAKELRDG